MAIVNGYCTEVELRSQLADGGLKLDTNLVQLAINASSRAIDRHCRRKFWLETTTSTRLYKAGSASRVVVDDIGTTTGLIIETDPTMDATWSTTWTSADYQLGPLNADVVATGDVGAAYAFWSIEAINLLEFPTDRRRACVRVTARFGWSSVPDEVTEACVLKAASLLKRKDAPFGVAGFGEFGAVRISPTGDPDVVMLLRDYRRMSALVG